MPVTAKLSRAFYDRFGDEIVAELVEWLNQVNDAYRSDLTQVIEANNRRIDGGFGHLRAELRADLAETSAALRQEIVETNAGLRREIAETNAALRQEIVETNAGLRREIAETNAALRRDMTDGFAALGVQIANVRADLMKWSFLFWVGAVASIALLAGVIR
jgi:hypothetical protein